MNPPAAIHPIEKNVVLVGAGNAHLVFVRRWGMRPVPGVAVTLVSEAPVIPYSAMVPGHIAGEYSRDDITIDLVRLCQRVKVRFVAERVVGIDPAARQIRFAARPPLSYDALSLGLGSLPALPPGAAGAEGSFAMRPLGKLLDRLNQIQQELGRSPRPFHLAVVGGGASGCELTLAIHKRFAGIPDFRLSLLQGNPRLLPNFPSGAARAFEKAFQERGIAWHVNARVTGFENGALRVEKGEPVVCDAVLWATEAASHGLMRTSGLAVNEAGFLRVKDTLQSVSDPAVFGTGDCVSFDSFPDLQKNGVYAVREGAVLFDNVLAFLRDRPLRPFRPQRWCMCMLNTADGRAVLSYGPFTAAGRWARWLKDLIDHAWMAKYKNFAPMPPVQAGEPAEYTMRCGGCGSKIAGDVLSAALRRLDLPDDPRVLVGCRAGEDAAVHRVRPELFSGRPDKLVEVQTVDFFKAFVDDPYLFGRIAALHAVSDLHAMNARPFSALAIATLPYARGPIQEAQLHELLSGALETFKQDGVVLTGGHTTEGGELALGFSITGFGEEDRLFRKGALRPGDKLVLTKPLGTGALLAAWMRGECRADWFERLIPVMLQSNAGAARVFAEAGVTACTDITGFGLAGHLLEMLDAGGVSARLTSQEIPLLSGFKDVVSRGLVSSLHPDNARVGCRVNGPAALPAWLFDPQTSGGLLAAVKSESVAGVLDQLRRAGFAEAAVVGEVILMEAPPPVITLD